MPHILVVADGQHDQSEGSVTLRERINRTDLESHHFAAHLLERLEWAVDDAHAEEVAGRSDLEPRVASTAC